MITTYTATLVSPLHHGAGTSGNTSLLRTQEVVTPDGRHASVPFVSAGSIRHGLRDALAWHIADTLGLTPGTLTKAQVDLLWSGGAVTTTGAETDLEMMRRVEDVLPSLAMLGYAAQSDIISGTLRASDLILVCEENAWRLPESARELPPAGKRAAAYRTEEFGTRHDVASSPVARLVDAAAYIVGAKTTQMIYDVQALKAGSVLSGHLMLTPAATEAHELVLSAAVDLWATDGMTHLGAKSATGYGQARIDGLTGGGLDWWTGHLNDRRDDILTLLADLTR